MADTYKYIVQENQNIFDIVLQESGSLERMFDYFATMGKTSLNAELEAGEELILKNAEVATKQVVQYFKVNKRYVATGVNPVVYVIGTTEENEAISSNDLIFIV